MAIDYDTAGTGLFVHLGKLIKHVNLLATDATNLDTDRDDIEDSFESGDQTDHIASLASSVSSLQSAHVSLRSGLVAMAASRITDLESVVQELDLPTSDLQTVLAALITRMNDDSENVDASTVTIGTVTADGNNTGNGTVLASKVLDGATSPGGSIRPHIAYDGLDSELSVTETMTLTCAQDSQTDGLTEGQEVFNWHGEQGVTGWSTQDEGSGNGPPVTSLNSYSIIDNRNFENFTSNAPDDWDVDNGTAGTHIDDEDTEVYRGSASLKFIGDGSEATIEISQAMTLTQLTPRKRYCLAIRYKASATDTVSQSFTVQFEGTGYTASSSEKITVTGDNFETDWTLEHFFINMPATLPSDMKLVIKAEGTLNNGKTLYFDSLAFGPVTWHNGVNCALIAGSDPFVRGDKFTFTVTNDKAGTFQEFFRRAWGVQLPSEGTGNETIDDALAG